MEEDLQVHAEGQVSGVFPVIFGLYIDGQLVAAVDLRQAGQAWTNVVGMCFIARIDQVVLVIQRGARADVILNQLNILQNIGHNSMAHLKN